MGPRVVRTLHVHGALYRQDTTYAWGLFLDGTKPVFSSRSNQHLKNNSIKITTASMKHQWRAYLNMDGVPSMKQTW